MAPQERSPQDSLSGGGPRWLDRLLAEPGRHDPFAAIALLEQLTREAPRVGTDGPYAEEAIRFRHSRSLAFKPGDIDEAEVLPGPAQRQQDGPEQVYELTLNIVGLTGTSSPLPTYLASEAAAHDEAGETKADFFDLFHHRLHSLLYRGLRKFDWPREYLSDGVDAWSRRMLALLGIDTFDRPSLRYIRPLDLLRIAPLLAVSARTAETLELAIEEILGYMLGDAEVRIEQFRGSWADIDQDSKIRLAVENSNLGISAVLGDMCLHRAGLARIVVGPLSEEELRRFLVGGEGYTALQELLDVLAYELVDFELELILAKEAHRGTILGVSKIGDDAWLTSGEDSTTREETRMIVSLSEAKAMMKERG